MDTRDDSYIASSMSEWNMNPAMQKVQMRIFILHNYIFAIYDMVFLSPFQDARHNRGSLWEADDREGIFLVKRHLRNTQVGHKSMPGRSA